MPTNTSITNESVSNEVLTAFEKYLVADGKGSKTVVSYTANHGDGSCGPKKKAKIKRSAN